MKKIFKKTLGVIFIILGFIALITPFTPGSWLLPIGLEILGLRILLERRLLALFLKDEQINRLKNLVRRIMPVRRRRSGSLQVKPSPPHHQDKEQVS